MIPSLRHDEILNLLAPLILNSPDRCCSLTRLGGIPEVRITCQYLD